MRLTALVAILLALACPPAAFALLAPPNANLAPDTH